MKKIYLSLIVVSLSLLFGCNDENKHIVSTGGDNTISLHFYASIESQSDSLNETKSTLSGTSTDAIRKVLWETADSIYVTNGTSSSVFYNVNKEEANIADFSGKISQGDTYYAAFPYGIVKSFSSTSFKITLPSVQTYKADGISSESFPMVAQCIDKEFEFKNLCGILVLNLTGTQVIDSIRFSGKDAQDNKMKVSGSASVSMSYEGYPELVMSNDAGTSVVLNCVGLDNKGVTLSTSKATPFHIVLPAGSYSHFELQIYSNGKEVKPIQSDKTLTIRRSKRTTTTSLEYEAEFVEPIDLGLSVLWGSCNLGGCSPQDIGDYYAWAEIEPKTNFNASNYKYWKKFKKGTIIYQLFTKYNIDATSLWDYVDHKTELEDVDDAVVNNIGNGWRIPTKKEIEELIQNCRCEISNENGVRGVRLYSTVNGFTDQSIFLPYSGYYYEGSLNNTETHYWSASLYTQENTYTNYTHLVNTIQLTEESGIVEGNTVRYYGCLIRPVRPLSININSILFDNDIYNIEEGGYFQINTITDPLYANKKDISYESSDENIAFVNAEGIVFGLSSGTATIKAYYSQNTSVYTTCTVTVDKPKEFVDLGLSVNWATFNVGANYPEEYGDYYAWGEIETKTLYYWPNYKYCNSSETALTKYCTNSDDGNNGFTDNIMILDTEDDVAQVKWGGSWRLPTKEEQEELLNNCTWSWTTQNGVSGVRITSRVSGYTDRSIFLPAAGFFDGLTITRAGSSGDYWSSSLYTPRPKFSYGFEFNSDNENMYGNERAYGRSVRPVCPSDTWLNNVSITLNSLSASITIGFPYSLSATVKHGNDVLDRTVSWSSSNPSVATVTENGLVSGISVGSATITAECYGKTATCEIIVLEPVYQYVDLGLSVNWATFNVGANSPEEYGNYYSWGETETKTDFSWLTYKYRSNGGDWQTVKFSKYNISSNYGTIDEKITLDPEDDVAHVEWGGNWRLPSKTEFEELFSNCSFEYSTQNGVNGYIVNSNVSGYEDKSIFLPAAGHYQTDNTRPGLGSVAHYWSNSLYTSLPRRAWRSAISTNSIQVDPDDRNYGLPIRPVCPSETWLNGLTVTLNETQATLPVDASITLTATVKHGSDVINDIITWSSENESVATINSSGKITTVGVGSTTITASFKGKNATCTIVVYEANNNGIEYVDLGLRVNWASYNVGANKPEASGAYYAWGENETKNSYDWSNYRWYNQSTSTYLKYATEGNFIDNNTYLDLSDDVAHVEFGGDWRMPTELEYDDLIRNCTWEWTSQGGVQGYKITSKIEGYTHNYIFLPAVGSNGNNVSTCYYWTNSLKANDQGSSYSLVAGGSGKEVSDRSRSIGQSVRAVFPSSQWAKDLNVTLNLEEIEIGIGERKSITANAIRNNESNWRWYRTWTSSNPSVASVDEFGNVKGKAAGTAIITVDYYGKTASCIVTVISNYEYVDLGLSVKWAKCNVGASAPEEYGDYFAWGETETKSRYYWSEYIYGGSTSLTKYNHTSGIGYNGYTDDKTELDLSDDVAHVIWGGNWRMPTLSEFNELLNSNNCTWTWSTINGVKGYLVTSLKTGCEGNSIFLPAAGYYEYSENIYEGTIGRYWTKTLNSVECYGKSQNFQQSNKNDSQNSYRYLGLTVRPVCP